MTISKVVMSFKVSHARQSSDTALDGGSDVVKINVGARLRTASTSAVEPAI